MKIPSRFFLLMHATYFTGTEIYKEDPLASHREKKTMDLSIRTWHLRTAFVHYVLFCSPQLASSELSPQSFSPSQMKGGKAQRPVPH